MSIQKLYELSEVPETTGLTLGSVRQYVSRGVIPALYLGRKRVVGRCTRADLRGRNKGPDTEEGSCLKRSTPMKKLRLKLTRRGHLKLARGRKTLTLRETSELERLGHQSLDLAVMRRDAARAVMAANPPSPIVSAKIFPAAANN